MRVTRPATTRLDSHVDIPGVKAQGPAGTVKEDFPGGLFCPCFFGFWYVWMDLIFHLPWHQFGCKVLHHCVVQSAKRRELSSEPQLTVSICLESLNHLVDVLTGLYVNSTPWF